MINFKNLENELHNIRESILFDTQNSLNKINSIDWENLSQNDRVTMHEVVANFYDILKTIAK